MALHSTPKNHHNAPIEAWLSRFSRAIDRQALDDVTELFVDDCYWRDFIALTWNIYTAEGRPAIKDMLAATLAGIMPRDWHAHDVRELPDGITEAWITFETNCGHGKGHVRLKGDRCWTLFTTLQSLTGFEEHTGRNGNRELGVVHGANRNRKTWLEERQAEQAELGITQQPYCVIVGGGQGGIALAARLRRLNVPTIVIEKNRRPGDSWRKRYRSLCLHDPVWYDHMPYLPFPDHWPVFSPKDKIADWLEMYTKIMELNYWTSTTCRSARYDDAQQHWEIKVTREHDDIVLKPKHFVIATGMSGAPYVPDIPGVETFSGTVCHSSRFSGSDDYAGKRCVVLGSNNSAHDICAALWENGADVTMVQRSATQVVRSEMLMEHAWQRLYSEQAVRSGITTEIADLTAMSVPTRLAPDLQKPIYKKIAEQDAALYTGLKKAGFLFDFGDDDTGIQMQYLRRGGGYYIDVGASELIIRGDIKLKSGVSFERINPHSVTLTDGTELSADLIVFATGYGSMNGWAAQLISQDVADKVGKCWGLGSGTKNDPGPWEGELRNMWKPTHQPGLWFQGGNLMQARHFSLYLALQIKARQEQLSTPVYGMPEVHHRA